MYTSWIALELVLRVDARFVRPVSRLALGWDLSHSFGCYQAIDEISKCLQQMKAMLYGEGGPSIA